MALCWTMPKPPRSDAPAACALADADLRATLRTARDSGCSVSSADQMSSQPRSQNPGPYAAPDRDPATRPEARLTPLGRSSGTPADSRTRTDLCHHHPGRLRRRRPRLPGRPAHGRRPEGVCQPLPGRPAAGGRGRCRCSRRELARAWRAVNDEGSEEAKDRLAQRQARAAIALVRLGDAGSGLALVAAQRRSPAAELHRQLAEPPGSRPESDGGRARSAVFTRHPPPATRHPNMEPSSSTPRPRSAAP